MLEYNVISKWSGWWGGWGSESDIIGLLNAEAAEGWQLVRSESLRLFWWWCIPRPKVLLIFERQKASE